MTNSEYIEKLREAIVVDWKEIDDKNLYYLQKAAKAYINLLESKEWAVVPVILTEEMIDSYCMGMPNPYDIDMRITDSVCIAYQELLEAAPQYQPEKLDE